MRQINQSDRDDRLVLTFFSDCISDGYRNTHSVVSICFLTYKAYNIYYLAIF